MIIILNQDDLDFGRKKPSPGEVPFIQDFKGIGMQQINHAELVLYDTGDSLKVLKANQQLYDYPTRLRHIAAKPWHNE